MSNDRLQSIKQLLKDEYGIETEAQLEQAIKDMTPLDISIFVTSAGVTNK